MNKVLLTILAGLIVVGNIWSSEQSLTSSNSDSHIQDALFEKQQYSKCNDSQYLTQEKINTIMENHLLFKNKVNPIIADLLKDDVDLTNKTEEIETIVRLEKEYQQPRYLTIKTIFGHFIKDESGQKKEAIITAISQVDIGAVKEEKNVK